MQRFVTWTLLASILVAVLVDIGSRSKAAYDSRARAIALETAVVLDETNTAGQMDTAGPTDTPEPADTPVPTQPPLACPGTLHNVDWAVVSLKPSRYVGCTVDVAANMYQTQTMDGYVTYDCQLDPNRNHNWTIFADDYADVPPAINENTYVEIKATITQTAEAENSVGGAFQGYVPELKVQSIKPISAAQAHQLGMALT